MNKCSVDSLRKMTFNKNIKPYKFHADGIDISVQDWTELSIVFVKWLIQKGYLKVEKLPVHNHARRGKYFINSKPQHQLQEKDACWQSVGPYYVDTKYNAQSHVNNLLSTLKQLNVVIPQFQISFRAD